MFASKFIINVTRRSSFSSTTKMVLRRSNNIKHVNYFGTTIDGETPPKTAIVMLNMGGPNDLDETGPFLSNLFNDGEIIQLGPLQNYLGPWIAHRRTPKVRKQYDEIGGRSPIRIWTEKQGQGMVEILDKISPETAPHKHYIMFRYAAPLTEETLLQMKADGVTRAIAFSQYPHWSCTTSGSSMNHLWRELKRLNMGDDFEWSLIDRWPLHDGFLNAVKKRITIGLEQFDESERDNVVIVFTAHSLPMRVVNRGDQYPQEVGATCQAVMEKLNYSNKYIMAWQSQVGPLPWLGPQTGEVIKGLAAQGHKKVLAVPIAFTSDHIETLYEIDIEYAEEAEEVGIQLKRAPSLNDEPLFIEAQADLVYNHLKNGDVCSSQYGMNCAMCVNPTCRTIINPIGDYNRLRDTAKGLETPRIVENLQ
tara:strand:+ start:87 stop:1346 length:1260 start_codon:yes stop_codon:yes gene_type:complete